MVSIYVRKKVYKIVKKQPKSSIRTGKNKHTITYIKGNTRYIRAKKGNQIRYDK